MFQPPTQNIPQNVEIEDLEGKNPQAPLQLISPNPSLEKKTPFHLTSTQETIP
jgi:hypothetical protein